MLQELLEENNFSKSESLVYIELLKLGESKSGEIIKKSGLQSSVVHNALNTLSEKGFVSHVMKGKIKHYRALDPEIISHSIKDKYEQFKRALPEFDLLKNKEKRQVEVEVYEGFKGLYTAHLKLIEDSEKGVSCKYFASLEMSEEAREFFKKMDTDRTYKKMKVLGIATKEMKNILGTYSSSTIKFIEGNIPPPMNICNDKVLFYILSEKPFGILVHSQELAEQYHKLWDTLWSVSQ